MIICRLKANLSRRNKNQRTNADVNIFAIEFDYRSIYSSIKNNSVELVRLSKNLLCDDKCAVRRKEFIGPTTNLGVREIFSRTIEIRLELKKNKYIK